MSKQVVVVTTKPDQNQAEYAIVEDGQILRHGEVLGFTLEDLSHEQLSALAAARNVLQALAEADAAIKGLTA